MDNQLENIKQQFFQLNIQGKKIKLDGKWWKIFIYPRFIQLRRAKIQAQYLTDEELLRRWRVEDGKLQRAVWILYSGMGREKIAWQNIEIKENKNG